MAASIAAVPDATRIVAAVSTLDPAEFDGPRRPAPTPTNSFWTRIPTGLLNAAINASVGAHPIREESYTVRGSGRAGGQLPSSGSGSIGDALLAAVAAQKRAVRIARSDARRRASARASATTAGAHVSEYTSTAADPHTVADNSGDADSGGAGAFRRAATLFPPRQCNRDLSRVSADCLWNSAPLTPSTRVAAAAAAAAAAKVSASMNNSRTSGFCNCDSEQIMLHRGDFGGGIGLDGSMGTGLVLVPRPRADSPRPVRPVRHASEWAEVPPILEVAFPGAGTKQANGLDSSGLLAGNTQQANKFFSSGRSTAISASQSPPSNDFYPAGGSLQGSGLMALSELWAGMGGSDRSSAKEHGMLPIEREERHAYSQHQQAWRSAGGSQGSELRSGAAGSWMHSSSLPLQ